MSSSELAQLELLAQIDDVISRLQNWTAESSDWQTLESSRGMLRRLLQRVDPLRIRLDAPLVIATFGGTGVGKSSLVNALLGEEVSVAGRQRPTTTQPTLIVHRDTPLEGYGFPLDDVRIVRRENRLLRDWLILDCPDPDTSETEQQGTNLELLRRMIPFCDVLLYVSSQQKYRSGRVMDELADAATGCKLIFVQTHADLEDDIRADWRQRLAPQFQIAEMFFVDSRRALAEQQQGVRPGGEFGRLLDTLLQELSATQRIRIRQGNLFGLLSEALDQTLLRLQPTTATVEKLEATLAQQASALTRDLAQQLQDELLASRGLWERRLLGEVAQRWGLSPFSLVLRAWHGQANLLASLTLMRARSSAQLAIWGALYGARWWSERQQQSQESQHLQRALAAPVSAADLQKAEVIVSGDARDAGLLRESLSQAVRQLPEAVLVAEEEFWTLAKVRLDQEIADAAQRNSGWGLRLTYELAFSVLPIWLLYRIGKNFFYDSWWQGAPLLETNFYIPALLFLALWAGVLLFCFTARLRRGMTRRVRQIAADVAAVRLSGGLFPGLGERCRDFHSSLAQLRDIAHLVHHVRDQIADIPGLSSLRTTHQS